MFSHVVVGAKDIYESKKFYDAIFKYVRIDEKGFDQLERLFYRLGKQRFIVTLPIDEQDATCTNGGTIGFELASSEDVYAWHAAGVTNGGKSSESEPMFALMVNALLI